MLKSWASSSSIRSYSPAISEISVGSPSPPPCTKQNLQMTAETLQSLQTPVFQAPWKIKCLQLKKKSDISIIPSNTSDGDKCNQSDQSPERIKSFYIVDILGKNEKNRESEFRENKNKSKQEPKESVLMTTLPVNVSDEIDDIFIQSSFPIQIPLKTINQSIVWDPCILRDPLLLRNLISPAQLAHYEQRLAWDYQRQFEEQFHLQAQLLGGITRDSNLISTEDSSGRDSSSNGSSSCSLVNVESNDTIRSHKLRNCEFKKLENRSLNVLKVYTDDCKNSSKETPLNALFQLSTKNFDEEQDPTAISIFDTPSNPKKKRKSRTAFTNYQIFELEKRFLYQKYLSPADRDEIASALGLSNAQVITWFQNRRAKLKRDMEELKKDVESVKKLSANKSFLENVNDLSILKTRPVSKQPGTISEAVQTVATTTKAEIPRTIHNNPQPTHHVMATPSPMHTIESRSQQPRLHQHNNRG